MKLNFKSEYLSIRNFSEIELPKFVLVTGVNGTGKSHALEAIHQGRIHCDIATNPQADTRLFDWGTLVPNDAQVFDSRTLNQEQMQVINTINQIRHRHLQ